MQALCSKCGIELTSAWSFCPHCGTVVPQEPQPPLGHERHPARGAFGGLVYGFIAAPVLIIPGILLCLLGWGVFLGVPMIVMGILAPLAGPVFGMGEHRGKCPSCGTTVLTTADGKMHYCPRCNEQFAVKGREVISAG